MAQSAWLRLAGLDRPMMNGAGAGAGAGANEGKERDGGGSESRGCGYVVVLVNCSQAQGVGGRWNCKTPTLWDSRGAHSQKARQLQARMRSTSTRGTQDPYFPQWGPSAFADLQTDLHQDYPDLSRPTTWILGRITRDRYSLQRKRG